MTSATRVEVLIGTVVTLALVAATLVSFVSSEAIADEIVVRCRADGSVFVDPHVVATRPDGVHVNVELQQKRWTSIRGLDLYVKHDPTVVSSVRPGKHEVACIHDRPLGYEPVTEWVEIVDPGRYWVPHGEVTCSDGEGVAMLSSSGAGGTGVFGDPESAMRETFTDAIRPSDRVIVSGYPRSGDRRFHVIRDGRTMFAADLWQTEFGGWTFGNFEECSERTT